MGNCGFKGFGIGIGIGSGVEKMMVKVVTSSGGIMELHPPITAECITNEFPGHALFRSRDLFSQPLLHSQQLQAGELYHLLPHLTTTATANSSSMVSAAPYRMSFENKQLVQGSILKRSSEVLPRYNNGSKGVWKVKLVISPHRLSEILSHDARTEALIESVRTVAKCGTAVVGGGGGGLLSSSSSLSNSDHCTFSTTP